MVMEVTQKSLSMWHFGIHRFESDKPIGKNVTPNIYQSNEWATATSIRINQIVLSPFGSAASNFSISKALYFIFF